MDELYQPPTAEALFETTSSLIGSMYEYEKYANWCLEKGIEPIQYDVWVFGRMPVIEGVDNLGQRVS